ncbi:hypothetical protein [Endozoicomonas sp. 4G]|uniref:hypothetical protein n=1 Tax=Endozoicomonas sp. 4G TaxID=2872754 RepID=UPI002078C98C|nr:hypothetical protein [Endozoicomonas sp. 4G]
MTDLLIEEQIAAALDTVIPDQAWPVILPQNPEYPAITYHRLNYEIKSDQWSLNPLQLRNANGPRSLFQVVIYAHPYTLCAKLLREVKAALETVPGMQLDSVQDGYEFEQSIYAIITEWTVWGDLETRIQDDPGDWPLVKPYADAILSNLTAHFTDRVTTLRFHDPAQRPLVAPAIILDLESFALGEDPGDGRVPVQASWTLHCLMPQSAENSEILVRSLAAEVFALVQFNKWQLGKETDFPENLDASQGTLWPGMHGHNHWTVSWDQMLYVTLKADSTPPFCPDECYSSFEPATGETFEECYELIEPEETP